MEYITLNNGIKMPIIGFGTYGTKTHILQIFCQTLINKPYLFLIVFISAILNIF